MKKIVTSIFIITFHKNNLETLLNRVPIEMTFDRFLITILAKFILVHIN